MRITTLIIAGLLCLLTSCDPVLKAELINETDRKIILIIKFDTTGLNNKYENNMYVPVLESFNGEPGVSTIIMDTINLEGTFILSPKAKITISEDIRGPHFEIFSTMKIIDQDTISLSNKEEIKKAFKKTSSFKWQLIVK